MTHRVSAARALLRALARKCPRCGRGSLFVRWLKMTERCPGCRLLFEREEGAFLGSLVINYGVTALVEIAYLIVVLAVTLPHPNVAVLTTGAVGIAIVIPVIVYPFAKTTWAAVDMLLHPQPNGPSD